MKAHNTPPHKNTRPNVDSNIVQNSQKVEQSNAISWWMGKYNTDDGILLIKEMNHKHMLEHQ